MLYVYLCSACMQQYPVKDTPSSQAELLAGDMPLGFLARELPCSEADWVSFVRYVLVAKTVNTWTAGMGCRSLLLTTDSGALHEGHCIRGSAPVAWSCGQHM